MKHIKNPEVAQVLKKYPPAIRKRMSVLRKLVLQTAKRDEIVQLEETLKWGEPSFVAKGGSTIRMGWKKSHPDRYSLLFNCNTTLVETFKELYGDQLSFEGKRAITFELKEEVPLDELSHCISLSLTYHQRKHLPMLGA